MFASTTSRSLDGFATGDGQTLEAPFGHAGHRLHEWLLATRYAHREVLGQPGGTEGVDDAIADRHGHRNTSCSAFASSAAVGSGSHVRGSPIAWAGRTPDKARIEPTSANAPIACPLDFLPIGLKHAESGCQPNFATARRVR